VVARPGVPAPTRLSAFVVPDRPSPVQRLPDKDGHYVFELGENLSSRCAPSVFRHAIFVQRSVRSPYEESRAYTNMLTRCAGVSCR